MLIYLQGLVGCLLFTYLFLSRGRAVIRNASQQNSKALGIYKKIIGRGMIIFGIVSAFMGLILLIMLILEVIR